MIMILQRQKNKNKNISTKLWNQQQEWILSIMFLLWFLVFFLFLFWSFNSLKFQCISSKIIITIGVNAYLINFFLLIMFFCCCCCKAYTLTSNGNNNKNNNNNSLYYYLWLDFYLCFVVRNQVSQLLIKINE